MKNVNLSHSEIEMIISALEFICNDMQQDVAKVHEGGIAYQQLTVLLMDYDGLLGKFEDIRDKQ